MGRGVEEVLRVGVGGWGLERLCGRGGGDMKYACWIIVFHSVQAGHFAAGVLSNKFAHAGLILKLL